MALREIGHVQHLVSSQNHLGEGPVWDARENCLYWVDLFKNRIYQWSPSQPGQAKDIPLPHMVSAIGLRASGFVLATSDGFAYIDPNYHVENIYAFPHMLQPGAHSNDGAVDRQGRFWAGTAAGPQPNNHLYCLSADASVRTMETGIGISNGIAWSPDNLVMYYVDSPKRVIYAYDFDPTTGSMSNRRDLVETPGSHDAPDGITVDAEGYIWCARWDGWRIVRYAPDGCIDAEIQLPVQRPTSCTFGGEDLKTLYITSARTGLDHKQLKQQPLAGDIFTVDTPIAGIAEPIFVE